MNTDDSHKDVYTLHGMSCSYFTGKLEAYLQVKGIPFHFVEMDRRDMRACAAATGIAQLPCIQTPDGSWLTDTTPIIQYFEDQATGPSLRPGVPATAFASMLLEDLFDEWYWRPALYYRWAFDEDAKLMSTRIAKTLMRDMHLPLALRRRLILHRQRRVYLKQDGVTRSTAPAIEALYLDSLRALNEVLSQRPFLFGELPCEADFGMFGPFFRHFFCDPTPGALMRDHAPHVAHWVTRLWKTCPADIADSLPVAGVPDDLGFLFDMAGKDYLHYLKANSEAVTAGANDVSYQAQGVEWKIPTAPYRAECFNLLKQGFAGLDDAARQQVAAWLPAEGVATLQEPSSEMQSQSSWQGLRGRLWRPVS